MKTLLTAIVALMISQAAMSQDAEIKSLETDDFNVEYPANWELNTDGQSGTKFIILSPADGEGDTFRENVNLIVQDLSTSPMSLDDFAELSMTQIMSAGAKVVENEQSAGEPIRQKIGFEMTQSGFDLRLIQYYWMVDNNAYVLTLTCLKGDQDVYWEAGKKILDSFKLNSN